jgi:hypothetical protein
MSSLVSLSNGVTMVFDSIPNFAALLRFNIREPSMTCRPARGSLAARRAVISAAAAWEKHVLSARGFKQVERDSEYAI